MASSPQGGATDCIALDIAKLSKAAAIISRRHDELSSDTTVLISSLFDLIGERPPVLPDIPKWHCLFTAMATSSSLASVMPRHLTQVSDSPSNLYPVPEPDYGAPPTGPSLESTLEHVWRSLDRLEQTGSVLIAARRAAATASLSWYAVRYHDTASTELWLNVEAASVMAALEGREGTEALRIEEFKSCLRRAGDAYRERLVHAVKEVGALEPWPPGGA